MKPCHPRSPSPLRHDAPTPHTPHPSWLPRRSVQLRPLCLRAFAQCVRPNAASPSLQALHCHARRRSTASCRAPRSHRPGRESSSLPPQRPRARPSTGIQTAENAGRCPPDHPCPRQESSCTQTGPCSLDRAAHHLATVSAQTDMILSARNPAASAPHCLRPQRPAPQCASWPGPARTSSCHRQKVLGSRQSSPCTPCRQLCRPARPRPRSSSPPFCTHESCPSRRSPHTASCHPVSTQPRHASPPPDRCLPPQASCAPRAARHPARQSRSRRRGSQSTAPQSERHRRARQAQTDTARRQSSCRPDESPARWAGPRSHYAGQVLAARRSP